MEESILRKYFLFSLFMISYNSGEELKLFLGFLRKKVHRKSLIFNASMIIHDFRRNTIILRIKILNHFSKENSSLCSCRLTTALFMMMVYSPITTNNYCLYHLFFCIILSIISVSLFVGSRTGVVTVQIM